MSLYSFHGNPSHPINPVIAIQAKHKGMRYFHFGIFNTDGFFLYISASFIPRQNSHKYCKKKLFHTLSSPNPKIPTIVAHDRLIISDAKYPPH